MKTKIIIFVFAFAVGLISCKKDKEVVDPIYEFVAFQDMALVNVGEASNVTVGYPVVIQLYAFKPYTEDITVTLVTTGHNAVENTDFTVTPDNSVKIPAGRLTSDTIWVKTIDNGVPNELDRTFDIAITTISKSELKIGLGIADPKQVSVNFKIADDECSGDPICVFNTTLTNTIDDGGSGGVTTAAVVLDKNNHKITLTGDLINYSTFSGATLTVTLTPDADGSHTGSATFGEQETGTDGDGYAYKFTETTPGTYNADTGTITLTYDIYYEDGGWVYWYSVTDVLTVP